MRIPSPGGKKQSWVSKRPSKDRFKGGKVCWSFEVDEGGRRVEKREKTREKGGKVTPEGSPFEQRAVSQAGNASGRRLAATQTFQTTRLPAYVKRLARDTQVTQLKRPSCNGERWRNRKKQTDVSGRRMYAIYIYIYFPERDEGTSFCRFEFSSLLPSFLRRNQRAASISRRWIDSLEENGRRDLITKFFSPLKPLITVVVFGEKTLV